MCQQLLVSLNNDAKFLGFGVICMLSESEMWIYGMLADCYNCSKDIEINISIVPDVDIYELASELSRNISSDIDWLEVLKGNKTINGVIR